MPPARRPRDATDQAMKEKKTLRTRAGRRGGRLREAEHERGAVLLGDEGAELLPGLLDGLLVLGADDGVALRHGCRG